MLPDVKQFAAALEAAATKRDAALAALDMECDYAASATYCPRCVAAKPIKEAHRVAAATAWSALKGAADPLVRWIAENCEEYTYEAQTVLEALPASMDELEALADENGWCLAWENYVREARMAGVLPTDTEVSA